MGCAPCTNAGQHCRPDIYLGPGHADPELCFSRSQVRDPAYALLDSGANHVLLPGHMLPKGAREFEVAINLPIAKKKARCLRNEVYAEDQAHPLLPLGRLANLSVLDTKFVWENGQMSHRCVKRHHCEFPWNTVHCSKSQGRAGL